MLVIARANVYPVLLVVNGSEKCDLVVIFERGLNCFIGSTRPALSWRSICLVILCAS